MEESEKNHYVTCSHCRGRTEHIEYSDAYRCTVCDSITRSSDMKGGFTDNATKTIDVDKLSLTGIVECASKPLETDPLGVGQHELGAKLDAGKPMADLVLGDFSNALLAVADVGTFGANKYTRHGWRYVQDGQERYADAGVRHRLKGHQEDLDPDSGLLHKAHEAWNVLAELEYMLSGGDLEDPVENDCQ